MRSKPNNTFLNMMHRSARAIAPELLAKKNVQFVTIGQKRTKGVRTHEASVVVYVTRKEHVGGSDRIPKTIPAVSRSRAKTPIQTDVVELHGDPAAFGVKAGNVLLASDMNYGVCGLSFNKNGTGYVLTNAHVGCNIPQGGAPCTLNLLNPGSNQPLPVGPVIWSSGLAPGQIATNDAAIARADQIAVEPYQILNVSQGLSGTSHFVQGNTTYWFMWNGVEFDCAYPEPVLHPAWINVEGVNIQYDGFWILQMTRGASASGQSGALICRTDNGTDVIGCGLIFGGSAPNLIFAFPFDAAFDQAYSALP